MVIPQQIEGYLEELLYHFACTELSVQGTRAVQHFSLSPSFSVSKSRVECDHSFIEDLQMFSFSQGLPLHRECPESGGVILFMRQSVRWHCVIPPLSTHTGILSLRKLPALHWGPLLFEDPYNLTNQLDSWMSDGSSLIFCGPTGAGKSSLLLQLLMSAARQERVLLLEKIRELPLLSPSWIQLAEVMIGDYSYGMEKLLQLGLRLRPDRIVIGECRGKEIETFVEALHCAHGGVMTTVHAASRLDLLQRFGYAVSKVQPEKKLRAVFLERGDPPRIVGAENLA